MSPTNQAFDSLSESSLRGSLPDGFGGFDGIGGLGEHLALLLFVLQNAG